jgi:competence protein ComEA
VSVKRFLTTFAAIGLTVAPVLAQTPSPASPTRPALTTPPPTSLAPVPSTQTVRPATSTPPGTTPAAKMTNLNTASAPEIDALPDIGKARTKVILDERAKGRFKDWADFDKRMTGTSVNAGVKAKIKDMVTF